MATNRADTLALLLVQGYTVEKVQAYAAQQWNLETDEAAALVAESRTKLTLAADYAKDEQVGTAITRLNDLYAKSVKDGDFKTALQAQREMNRLMNLYVPDEIDGASQRESEAEQRLSLIESYISPLELTDSRYPLEEHCRVAAEIIRQQKNASV